MRRKNFNIWAFGLRPSYCKVRLFSSNCPLCMITAALHSISSLSAELSRNLSKDFSLEKFEKGSYMHRVLEWTVCRHVHAILDIWLDLLKKLLSCLSTDQEFSTVHWSVRLELSINGA